jgi:hypothetical protein
MTVAAHPMASWLADLEAAFDETARGALGADAVAVTARGEHPRPSWQGAYLGLVGPSGALQIGLAAEEPVCQALAKGLLGMDPGDEALPAAEMADAVCEIVNIVAGAFKGRVRDRAAQLTMGLPTFFHGGVQETERTAVKVAEVRFGDLPAALLLIHPRGAAPEA